MKPLDISQNKNEDSINICHYCTCLCFNCICRCAGEYQRATNDFGNYEFRVQIKEISNFINRIPV